MKYYIQADPLTPVDGVLAVIVTTFEAPALSTHHADVLAVTLGS
jgi:hypothetical protein